MNTNKTNQGHAKHDGNAPKQNQPQTPTQGKSREDGQAKGTEEKPVSMPGKNKGNKSGK